MTEVQRHRYFGKVVGCKKIRVLQPLHYLSYGGVLKNGYIHNFSANKIYYKL